MEEVMLKPFVQIALFLICAQSVVHLRPKKEYEKYLKYLLSLMLFLQLLIPLKMVAAVWKWDFIIESNEAYERELNTYLNSIAEHIYQNDLTIISESEE